MAAQGVRAVSSGAADDGPGGLALAVALAGDRERLRGLRATMRERLLASPLMDHAGFTRELEGALRAAWVRRSGGR